MRENQNVEYKQIWRDEYLRWISAFANTTGGVIYIGVDDKGKVVGLENADELVYMIPHKIKDYLGILVETSIKRKKNKEYICIKVEKSPYPVSLRGRYYLRSGSNTYEAMGMELDRLMLKKLGIRWEKLSGDKSSISEIDPYVIDYFKSKSLENGKLTEREINVDNETLLKNLRLYNGKELSFAALLLFSKDPEEWVYNSFIKICEIDDNKNILRSDKIGGSILIQLEQTMDLLYQKYLNDDIPKAIMREILTNALMHKAYDAQNPIQINVHKNKVTIYNSSIYNPDITKETIYNSHPSIPANPRIANTFSKCGIASLWGLGIERMKEASFKENYLFPKFTINENGFLVKCSFRKKYLQDVKQRLLSEKLSKEEVLRYISESSLTIEEMNEAIRKRVKS